MALTPTVFWAVTPVIAVMPCAPQLANAFRSAWMPAPPPESDPAIDSRRGVLIGLIDAEDRSQAGAARS